MPQSDELRRKRQRKTKAQLIDELEAADARLATSTDRKLAKERLRQSQTMLLDLTRSNTTARAEPSPLIARKQPKI